MQLVDKDKFINKRRRLYTRTGSRGYTCVVWEDINTTEVFDLEAFEKEAYEEGYKACYEMCKEEDFAEHYSNGYDKAFDTFRNSGAVDWKKYYNYFYDNVVSDFGKQMLEFTKDENGNLVNWLGEPLIIDEKGNVLNAEE